MREYLAYFGSKNVEFRAPELESVARALNIPFWIEPLTTEQHTAVRPSNLPEAIL